MPWSSRRCALAAVAKSIAIATAHCLRVSIQGNSGASCSITRRYDENALHASPLQTQRARSLGPRPHAKAPHLEEARGRLRGLLLGLLLGDGSLGGLRESSKTGGIVIGDLRQHLAIEIVARQLQSVDEAGVAGAVGLAGRIDAHDPERAELPLLLLAPRVGEHLRALNGLLSCLVELGFCEEVAAGFLEDFLAAVSALGTAFDARHRVLLFAFRVCFPEKAKRLEERLSSSLALLLQVWCGRLMPPRGRNAVTGPLLIG